MGKSCHGESGKVVSRKGGSSMTTCEFGPPTPNELMAARRGFGPRSQRRSEVLTKNGLFWKSISGLGVLKFSEGGMTSFLSARTVLISPATPAAGARCPIFVFTEPIGQDWRGTSGP